MIDKNVNYAYPQKFAEGGEVEVTDLSGLQQEPLGNDMVLVKFQDGSYGKTQKALFEAAESLGAPMGSQKDFANWHLTEWAPKVVSDPAFIAAHDQFNTDQPSYNQKVMDSDPQYAQNRLAFVQTHAPNNAAAISAAEELVSTGNYLAKSPPVENPTFTDQVPGYTVGGVEFQGPDMPPPGGMATTMAVGEEDGGGLDGGGLDGGDVATTRMVGEEEGMDGFPGGMATTMAMGEEDGGGLMPNQPPPGMATTMAMGEEDGGNPFLPAPPPVDLKPLVPIPRPDNPFLNLDPPVGIKPPPNPFQPNPPVGINPPVPIPRPDNPFLPAPPPVGGPAPFNPFPQLPTGGQGGRTYGNEPVFGGFNPGKNIPVDEFGNPIYATFSNGGIAGLKR
jgi:hypothetical protein